MPYAMLILRAMYPMGYFGVIEQRFVEREIFLRCRQGQIEQMHSLHFMLTSGR